MMYDVYMQRSRPYPKTDKPWTLVCKTEAEEKPRDYDWNKIIIPLTGETIAQQNAKGIWYKVIPERN